LRGRQRVVSFAGDPVCAPASLVNDAGVLTEPVGVAGPSATLIYIALSRDASPTPLAGIATRHLPALSTGSAVLIGIALYFAVIRQRILSGKAGPPQASAD